MMMPSMFRSNVWDSFFGPSFSTFKNIGVETDLMKTDILDKKDAYELFIGIPGVKKEDIQAELKNGYLTIQASTSREEENKDENERYIRSERFYGTSRRSFYVGDQVKQEDISARYENGILKLRVPKKVNEGAEEDRRLIQIEG